MNENIRGVVPRIRQHFNQGADRRSAARREQVCELYFRDVTDVTPGKKPRTWFFEKMYDEIDFF